MQCRGPEACMYGPTKLCQSKRANTRVRIPNSFMGHIILYPLLLCQLIHKVSCLELTSPAQCTWQAFSSVGRCKTFDASGDGYGRGEACCVAALRPSNSEYSASALGMMLATATNQDGRSSSLTAPHGPSQAALISAAIVTAGASSQHACFWHALRKHMVEGTGGTDY